MLVTPPLPTSKVDGVGLANPASVYCIQLGYVLDGEGVRARIGGPDLDLRIGDVGKLRDGQARHRCPIRPDR